MVGQGDGPVEPGNETVAAGDQEALLVQRERAESQELVAAAAGGTVGVQDGISAFMNDVIPQGDALLVARAVPNGPHFPLTAAQIDCG